MKPSSIADAPTGVPSNNRGYVSAPLPKNEVQRLKALYYLDILDSESEKIFDDLTFVTSRLCDTPIALISLVAEDRQWFKSRIGVEATETSRDVSFCAHAILQPGVMEVKDATKDQRFAGNPLVTLDPHIRFYAGAPLRTEEGHALGSLCVLDHKPREMSPQQTEALVALSRVVVSLFKQRRYLSELKLNLC